MSDIKGEDDYCEDSSESEDESSDDDDDDYDDESIIEELDENFSDAGSDDSCRKKRTNMGSKKKVTSFLNTLFN